jgi:hypothetical protein
VVKSFFIALIFFSTPVVAMAQSSCFELFSNPNLQDILIAKMGELELSIQSRLRSEADPATQALLSNQLVELDSLINETLDTPQKNEFRLKKYAQALEEIESTLHPKTNKVAPVSPLETFTGLKLLVTQTPEAQIAAKNLPVYLANKYLSFLNEVESIESVDRLSEIWHLERFNVWAELSRAGFIVQLGGEHFVFFTVEPAQTISIRGFYDKRPVPLPLDEALR